MLLRKCAVLSIIVFFSLVFLVACGSSSTKATPPPTGGFSNSNLNGTYVFSVTGSDASGLFLTMAGTFVANGSGGITAGAMDLNDAGTGPLLSQAITGGVYSVGVDGRGDFRNGGGLTLQTAAGTFTFDFALSSSAHGLITEFDSNGTGSGTLDLQTVTTLSSSYAFNLSGIVQTPFATVGDFSLDSKGNVTAGLEDFNNNGSSTGETNLSITSGAVSLTSAPGTATLTSSAGGFNFHIYPIDSTHLKLIEVDTLPITSGDAFSQTSSIPANNVFTVAGFDSVAGGPFTAAGLLVTDGAGNVTSASAEDVNDFGNVPAPISFTGQYTALSGGRSVVTFLTAFINGNGGLGCSNCQFAAYPSSGGLQLLEIDDAGITSGVAYPQGSSPTLASGRGYGMNLTGSNFGNISGNFEEDDIAEFTNSNGSFTGVIDSNDQGSLTANQRFSATYAADSTIPGRGVITPVSNAFNLVSYMVDSSTAVFVEVDNNPVQVGLGSFSLQNATAKSNAAAAHLAVLRVTAGAMALKRR
jgi:hypothetical protein